MFNHLDAHITEDLNYFSDLKSMIMKINWSDQFKTEYLDVISIIETDYSNYSQEYDFYFTNPINSKLENRKLFSNIHKNDMAKVWKDIKNLLLNLELTDHMENTCKDNEIHFCPICGLEIENNANSKYRMSLDHVLPKSTINQYILYPKNLVPMCANCNHTKGSIMSKEVFHPYYAEGSIRPSSLLNVRTKSKKKRGRIKFIVDYKLNDDYSDDSVLQENYNNIFKLNKTYKERIYKQVAWNQYLPVVNNYKSHGKEALKRILLKEINIQIDEIQKIPVLSDKDELDYMTLESVINDLDNFLEEIISE